MSSELIVHVVGAKSDLAGQRAVTTDFARKSVKGWVSHGSSAAQQQEQLAAFNATADNTSSKPTSQSNAARSLGLSSLGGLRASSRRNTEDVSATSEPIQSPAWCEWNVSEVSAKDDFGECERTYAQFLV